MLGGHWEPAVTLREAGSSCDLGQARAGERQGSLGRPASLGRVMVERPRHSESAAMGRQEVLDRESESHPDPATRSLWDLG